MSPFVDRLDRFVRWFFDSSPTTVIEYRAAPPDPVASILRTSLLVGSALLVLLLLAVFHSVCTGAVERGAIRRAEPQVPDRVARAAPAPASRRAGPVVLRSLLLAGTAN